MMRQTRMVVALGCLGLAMVGVGPRQQDPVVTRLQQEVGQLRFQLDLQTDRLNRELEQLRAELANVRYSPRVLEPPASSSPAKVAAVDAMELRRLVIRDAEGRPRVVLSVGNEFGPLIALLDTAGNVDLLLSSPADGPRIERFDDSGRLLDGSAARRD